MFWNYLRRLKKERKKKSPDNWPKIGGRGAERERERERERGGGGGLDDVDRDKQTCLSSARKEGTNRMRDLLPSTGTSNGCCRQRRTLILTWRPRSQKAKKEGSAKTEEGENETCTLPAATMMVSPSSASKAAHPTSPPLLPMTAATRRRTHFSSRVTSRQFGRSSSDRTSRRQ